MRNYLERVLHILFSLGVLEIEELKFESEYEEAAELESVVRFSDGSRLRLGIIVDQLDGFPYRRFYSFHYMDSRDTTIFRYDNSRHHRGLTHFPHHKHEGADERVVGCPQPSISLIRDEIEAYLKGLN